MRTTDLDGIRAVIRRIRLEHYPDLDSSFLDAVLEIEAASPDDETRAQRLIREKVIAMEASA